MTKTYDLDAYRRHAERFGNECVFETATSDLPTVELGRLSLWMQKLDPKWRPPTDRVQFATQLIEAGEPRDRACQMAAVSRWTLRRAEELPHEGGQLPEWVSKPLIPRPALGADPAPPANESPNPVLHPTRAQNGAYRAWQCEGQLSFDYDGAGV